MNPRQPARPTVVLVAYYYPPLGGVGTQRALSFARYLPEHGYDVVVVTPRRGAYGLDPSLPGDDALRGVRVLRTGSFEPAVLARSLRRRRAAAPASGDMVESIGGGPIATLVRRALHATMYFPDHARGWIGPASRAVRRAASVMRIRAVVSTSPPVSGHVAAVKAARALGVPAVLDFRDLWTGLRAPGDRSSRAEAERRLEARLLRDASAVTTVSEAWRRWLLARFGEGDARPFRVLRNGFEETDFAGPAPSREPGVFRVVHAGTLYGARQDMTAFFRAVAALRRRGDFGPLRPEVALCGKLDPHALDAARGAGCEDLVTRRGFVTHGEAVAMMRSATVNLLHAWSDPGPFTDGMCPAKMYEQMAAGRPVLALCLPGVDARALVEEAGGALLADPRDQPAIERALQRFVSAEIEGDAARAAPPRSASLERFSRRSVARELAELLASLAR